MLFKKVSANSFSERRERIRKMMRSAKQWKLWGSRLKSWHLTNHLTLPVNPNQWSLASRQTKRSLSRSSKKKRQLWRKSTRKIKQRKKPWKKPKRTNVKARVQLHGEVRLEEILSVTPLVALVMRLRYFPRSASRSPRLKSKHESTIRFRNVLPLLMSHLLLLWKEV